MVLKKGNTVLLNGMKGEVISALGSGNFADVYQVKLPSCQVALKVFRSPKKDRADDRQRVRLLRMIRQKPPSGSFVWPKAIVDMPDGKLAYVMPLVPQGFYSLEKLFFDIGVPMTGRLKMMVSLCGAFQALHKQNKAYVDLSLTNIFASPDQYSVLLIDCESIIDAGESNSILGTEGWAAPEVMQNSNHASVHSDEHTLAVLIFNALMMTNPFEGKAFNSIKYYDDKQEYLKRPVFMFDPVDDSNRCENEDIKTLWDLLPAYVQQLFCTTFGPGLHQPDKRVCAKAWGQALLQLLVEGVVCKCGAHLSRSLLSVQQGMSHCPLCQRSFRIPAALRVNDYLVTLLPGRRLYQFCLDPSLPLGLKSIGKVHTPDGAHLALSNLGRDAWDVHGKAVGSNKSVLLTKHCHIRFPNGCEGVVVV